MKIYRLLTIASRNTLLACALITMVALGIAAMSGDIAFAAEDCADTSKTSFNWGASCATTDSLIATILQLLAGLVGVAVVIGIAWGGLLYTASNGDSSKAQQGITVIVNSIIGLFVFIFLFAITNYIVPGGVFGRATGAPAATPPRPAPSPAPESRSPTPTPSSPGNDGSDTPSNPQQTPTTFYPGQVLIIGDSITARATYDGNRGNKGWWEYLLAGKAGRFNFSAQGGSGYVHKGKEGTGTSFYDRIGAISRLKPKAIIIAGGLNDRAEPNAAAGIRNYYDRLATVLRANDIPKENVYVFVPRPEGLAKHIVPIVKSNAQRIGVNYIDAGVYTTMYDRLHPDTAGAKEITRAFKRASNFDERLKSTNR